MIIPNEIKIFITETIKVEVNKCKGEIEALKKEIKDLKVEIEILKEGGNI